MTRSGSNRHYLEGDAERPPLRHWLAKQSRAVSPPANQPLRGHEESAQQRGFFKYSRLPYIFCPCTDKMLNSFVGGGDDMIPIAMLGTYNVFDQTLSAGWVVLSVLVLLIVMSLASWAIIGYKWAVFKAVRRQTDKFFDVFWQSESLDTVFEASEQMNLSHVARVFRAAFSEMLRATKANNPTQTAFENTERTLRRAVQEEASRLERMLPFLATTGSAAPFIGLFGTVWGIMNAFGDISPDQPILQSVAPHIAHALIATAIGLLAAIPAVIFYNYFTSHIKTFRVQMDNFSIDFLNILKRHFLRD